MTQLDERNFRPLVQRLSRAAVVLDQALFGPPVCPARDVDYQARQQRQQQRAVKELAALREALEGLRL